jgi:mannosyltransferase
VIGAATASFRLGHRGLWLDEAYTLGAVHQLRDTLPGTSYTMAAYYLLLRPWLAVSQSVWWMRSLSVVAAVAAVAVTVVVARRLTGAREAGLAGVLVALSPLWFVQAREARSYAFVMLLVALSWLAVDHGLADGRGRARWWWAHTAVAVVLPLFHGLTILQLIPQLGAVLVARADRPTVLRALRSVGLSLALTAWLARTASADVGNWVDPLSLDQVWFVTGRLTSQWDLVAAALVGVVVVGAAVAVVHCGRAATPLARARALVPVLWGFGPLVLVALLSVARPSLVPRYVVGSVSGLALLMAAALARAVGARPRWPAARMVAAAAVVVALAAGQVALHDRPLDGWTVAARRVAAGLRPGDTILLSREYTTRPPFEAAWRDVDPAAPPRLLPSDRPLGQVRRFEPDETPGTVRWDEARQAGRIWLVADAHRLELDRLPHLVVDGIAGRPATHREVARWRAPRSTIVVVLLEPVA